MQQAAENMEQEIEISTEEVEASQDQHEQEIEQYSEKVQKRINQLTAQRKQALEEAQAALQYAQQTKQENESWIPGEDWLAYSGPMFDSDEYVAAVETLLGGWLIYGKKGREFEVEFAKHMGCDDGVLTTAAGDIDSSTKVYTLADSFTDQPIIVK